MTEHIRFIGDSITDADRRSDLLDRGSGYVDVVADELAARGVDAVVVNRGIAGDRVAHLRERWDADALAGSPDVLTVLIGVNDTLVTFFEGTPTPLDAFTRDLDDILGRAVAAGVGRLVVMEPFFVPGTLLPVGRQEGSDFVRNDLDRRRPVVRELAQRHGARLVPLQSAVDTAIRERGGVVVAPDGVHPSAFGHRLIARLWLEAYDEPATGRPLSA